MFLSLCNYWFKDGFNICNIFIFEHYYVSEQCVESKPASSKRPRKQRYFFSFQPNPQKGTYVFFLKDNWIFHRCFWSKSQATFFFTLKAIRATLIEIQGSNLVFIVTFILACWVSQSCFHSLCQIWVVFVQKLWSFFKQWLSFKSVNSDSISTNYSLSMIV